MIIKSMTYCLFIGLISTGTNHLYISNSKGKVYLAVQNPFDNNIIQEQRPPEIEPHPTDNTMYKLKKGGSSFFLYGALTSS